MAQTQTVTLKAATDDLAPQIAVGDALLIQTSAQDAQAFPSGAQVYLSSSDTTIAKLTTAEVVGDVTAAVIGVGVGTATITATAADNSGATATLSVTVTAS